MLEHFCVAEVKGFKLGKAELGKDILGGISAGDYPVDIPYILFRIVFVGRFSGYEYGGIMWYGNGFILKDKRAAAFGAVEYLVIVIALGSYKVILTVMMQRTKISTPYSYCYKLIISFIDLPVNS